MSYADKNASEKATTLQYISNHEYYQITTPEERSTIQQLSIEAATLKDQTVTDKEQILKQLQATIDKLWKKYQVLYISSK